MLINVNPALVNPCVFVYFEGYSPDSHIIWHWKNRRPRKWYQEPFAGDSSRVDIIIWLVVWCFGKWWETGWLPWLMMVNSGKYWLMEAGWWFGTFLLFFPYIGNNNPNGLSYFSEGLVYHQPVIHGDIFGWNFGTNSDSSYQLIHSSMKRLNTYTMTLVHMLYRNYGCFLWTT